MYVVLVQLRVLIFLQVLGHSILLMPGLSREDNLVKIFSERPKAYLQDLRKKYAELYRWDLLHRLQRETAGKHQKMFEAMLCTTPELRAHYVHDAVRGLGTNETLLIDALLTADANEMEETKRAYQHHFLLTMAFRVDFDTSGTFQKLLDCVLRHDRPMNGVQEPLIASDLETLYNSTEGKTLGVNHPVMLNLIQTRSAEHLQALNQAYPQRSGRGRTFVQEICAKEFGHVENAYVAFFLGPAGWTGHRVNLELKGLLGLHVEWDSLLRSVFLPRQDVLKTALRILSQDPYNEDLAQKIASHHFGGELERGLTVRRRVRGVCDSRLIFYAGLRQLCPHQYYGPRGLCLCATAVPAAAAAAAADSATAVQSGLPSPAGVRP
jgi:hypothetical protein